MTSLREAQKRLLPVSFFIKDSTVFCNDAFDPTQDYPEDIEFQGLVKLRDIFEKISADEVGAIDSGESNSEGYQGPRVYAYLYQLGVRGVLESDKDKLAKAQENGLVDEIKSLSLFYIEATFEARYFCESVLSDESISEFGEKNVPFNLWSFWREYIQNTSLRMGFKAPLIVPLYQPPTSVKKD